LKLASFFAIFRSFLRAISSYLLRKQKPPWPPMKAGAVLFNAGKR
jgi:hypothetical protein